MRAFQLLSLVFVAWVSAANAGDTPNATWTPLPPPTPGAPEVPPTPSGPPSAFSIDLSAASGDIAGVRLLNAVLNRIGLGKQLVAVAPKDAQNHIVALDFGGLLTADQRQAMTTLVPDGGTPIPIGTLLEALASPLVAALDSVATKADMERVGEFSEEKDFPKRAELKAAGVRENAVILAPNKIAARRLHAEKQGTVVTGTFEQWLITGPNKTVREYLFSMDGKRIVVPPAPTKATDGARTLIDRHLRELLRKRAPKPDILVWDQFLDLAKRADQGSNSAVDDEIRKFLASWTKLKASFTPTPAASPSPAAAGTPETPEASVTETPATK